MHGILGVDNLEYLFTKQTW